MKKNILITAPRHYTQRLLTAFEKYKEEVEVTNIAMVESTFDTANDEMQKLCADLGMFDFVVCLSRKAVDAMHNCCDCAEQLGKTQFLAIGKDNEYLHDVLGVTPPFISKEPSPIGIAHALKERGLNEGCRLAALAPAFVGMVEPRTVPDFMAKLSELGVQTHRVDAYVNMATELSARKQAYDLIIDKRIDCVAFTSGSEVMAFNDGLKEVYGTDACCILNDVAIACMGPYTAMQAKRIGLKVDWVPAEFNSFDDFTACLVKHWR